MPRGMGYKQRMDKQVKQPGGGYHGTGSVDNSYRYSKAKPPAGDAMRSSGGMHGSHGPQSGMRSKSHKGY